MKARITDTGVFIGIYTNEFLEANESFTAGWIFSNALPTLEELAELNKLKWNGSEYIEGLSAEELTELNKPKIPAYISRMNFKMTLLLKGIEIQDIIDTINSIPESMFSVIDKKLAIIKFNDAVSFDRYNADLNLVGVLMGLSQEDLDEIFLTGNNL